MSTTTFSDMEQFVLEEIDQTKLTEVIHTLPWGESIIPKSKTKLVFVGRYVIRFANTVESHVGYSQFTIPEEFPEMIEDDNLDYITFIKDGKEIGLKFRLTPLLE